MLGLIKTKKGEAYIDVIITVFLSILVLYVALGVFSVVYTYQQANNFAERFSQIVSVQGCTGNDRIDSAYEDLLSVYGFDPDKCTVSFEGSDIIVADNGIVNTIGAVQYGNTIKISFQAEKSIGFLNSSGFITVPINIMKTVSSQNYWNEGGLGDTALVSDERVLVTTALTNITANPVKQSVIKGSSVQISMSTNAMYEMPSDVSVVVGGILYTKDIDYTYTLIDEQTATLTLSNIYSACNITASAIVKSGSVFVEYDADRVSLTHSENGGRHTFFVQQKSGYSLSDVTVIKYNQDGSLNNVTTQSYTVNSGMISVTVIGDEKYVITISAEPLVFRLGKSLPTGCTYSPVSGVSYFEGTVIPNNFVVSTGDTLETNDYIYKYNFECSYNNSSGTSTWAVNESINGWSVYAKDKSKLSYEPIYNEIAGKPLTSLSHTFAYCRSLTEFPIIPNSVTVMNSSFIWCENLLTVTNLPSSLKTMEQTFATCHNLTSVCQIPTGVERIGSLTFSNCILINKINIPYTVTSISNDAFSMCNFYESLSSSSNGLRIIDNCLISTNSNLPANLIVPNGIRVIADNAFSGKTNLKSIVFAASTTHIGKSAFNGCTGLTSATQGNNVISIDSAAFMNCSSLNVYYIPISTSYVGGNAFMGCRAATIYCAADSAPATWQATWNSSNRPVIWAFE